MLITNPTQYILVRAIIPSCFTETEFKRTKEIQNAILVIFVVQLDYL